MFTGGNYGIFRWGFGLNESRAQGRQTCLRNRPLTIKQGCNRSTSQRGFGLRPIDRAQTSFVRYPLTKRGSAQAPVVRLLSLLDVGFCALPRFVGEL